MEAPYGPPDTTRIRGRAGIGGTRAGLCLLAQAGEGWREAAHSGLP
jgi:hypothetical protein